MAQVEYPPRDRLSLRAYIRARLRGRGLLEFADDDEEARSSADLVYVNCGRAWHEDAVARTPLKLEALLATTTDMPMQGIGNTVVDNDEFWSSTGSSNNAVGEALLYRFRQPLSHVSYVSVAVYRAFYQHGDPLYPPGKVSFLTGPTPNQLYPASPIYPVRLTDEQQFFALTPTAAVSRYLMVRLHGRRQRQWEDLQYYIAIRHVAAYGDLTNQPYDLQITRLARGGGLAWPCSRGLMSAVAMFGSLDGGHEAAQGIDGDAAGFGGTFWTPFRRGRTGGAAADQAVREDVFLAGPVSSAESRRVYGATALPRAALAAVLPERGVADEEALPLRRRGGPGLACAVMPSGPTEAELRLASQTAALLRALPHLVQVTWPGVLLARGAARRMQRRMEQKLRGRGQGLQGLKRQQHGGSLAFASGAATDRHQHFRTGGPILPPAAWETATGASGAGRRDARWQHGSSAPLAQRTGGAGPVPLGQRLIAEFYDSGVVSNAQRGWLGDDDDEVFDVYGYDEDEAGDACSSGDSDSGSDAGGIKGNRGVNMRAAGGLPWAAGRLRDWVVEAAAERGAASAEPTERNAEVYDNIDADTERKASSRHGEAAASSSGAGSSMACDGSSGGGSSSGAVLAAQAVSGQATGVGQDEPRTHRRAGEAILDIGVPALELLREVQVMLLARSDSTDLVRTAGGGAAAAASTAPGPGPGGAPAGTSIASTGGQVAELPVTLPRANASHAAAPQLHGQVDGREEGSGQQVRDDLRHQRLEAYFAAAQAKCAAARAKCAAARAKFEAVRARLEEYPGSSSSLLRHRRPQQPLPPPKLRRRGDAGLHVATAVRCGGGSGDAAAAASSSDVQRCWRHQRAALRAMQPAFYNPRKSSPLFVALEAWAGVGAAGGSAAAVVASGFNDASLGENTGCWLVSHYDHEHM